MPPRTIDPRLTALFGAFRLRRFHPYEAREVLGDYPPIGLVDDRWQLLDNRLVPCNPAVAAVRYWQRLYRPILSSMGDLITPTAFANAAQIPFPAANTILSMLHKAKILEQALGASATQGGIGGGPSNSYRLARRKVIIRSRQPRKVIIRSRA